MNEQKRKRSSNFSDFETNIVAELMVRHKDVIENKKTDGVTVKQKDKTWKKVAEEFNSISGVSYRSARNLKTCYENLKRKTRKICADNKVMNATGSGNFKPTLSKTTEKVMALIQQTTTPLMYAHDLDALYQGHVNEVQGQAEALNPLLKPPINSMTQPACLLSSHTAVQPSTSADTVLSDRAKSRRRRLSTSRDKIIDSCERRISVLDYQLEVMRKEHGKEMEIKELKLNIMKDKLKHWQNMNKNEDRPN
ncbi:myb/SANT-like DNA-binding domain-containing protein 3 isoform X3 [Anabrus simplex]|uniref:myb/SANT-like DNA-binding domain-containing protein 3 isoform X3 n=1 Tax=Anabrus simplex TaxID=316456 RepID=UPI0035A2A2CC